MTTILEKVLALSEASRRRLIAAWLDYFKAMDEPEYVRTARLTAEADRIIRDYEAGEKPPEGYDDALLTPLVDAELASPLMTLDDELMWLPLPVQQQLIKLAQGWDNPTLAGLDPEARRAYLFTELASWHASLTQ